VIDALLATASTDFAITDPAVAKVLALDRQVVLVTAHRRENWGEPMRRICIAVARLVDKLVDIEVVFPMHRNPIVRETVEDVLGGRERIHLIEPPDYAPFVKLEKKSTLILTDSGGVQEEAPSLGKPVLVLRETTERPEGVAAGTAKLVGTDVDRIFETAYDLLTNETSYRTMAHAESPYGDGRASRQIADAIAGFLSQHVH
jgi:UDP-N-acetylglucosamine 2-epimerase (non-hydrolysing)